MGDDDYQHALRAWTIAEEYERTLQAWAEANLRTGAQKVAEIGVRYTKRACRMCTTEDASVDVVTTCRDAAGGSRTTTVFDSPELLRSLSKLLLDLAEIADRS